MFRARRMMELTEMVDRIETERERRTDEDTALAAMLDEFAADEEATTVLNIAAVLKHLESGRLDQDRTGVQVLGAEATSRGEIVLICPEDPDDVISELIRGPWNPDQPSAEQVMVLQADEEPSEILRGPWTEPVETVTLAPGELEAAILEADDESSEILRGPWMADEEATCVYNQEELEALLRGR
ncbi:MAG: hypothetical protein ACI8RZ_001319 [Myxococcota bacterium]|jgi:hypothetical protein